MSVSFEFLSLRVALSARALHLLAWNIFACCVAFFACRQVMQRISRSQLYQRELFQALRDGHVAVRSLILVGTYRYVFFVRLACAGVPVCFRKS